MIATIYKRSRQRTKTLRKLDKGKTFTEQYKFKRLLKTEPSVLRLYKIQEKAINSIPAVKDIAIYESQSILPFPVPGEYGEVGPGDAAPFTRLHRGEANWPRRIEFAEQIPDISNKGGHVWAVSLHVTGGEPIGAGTNIGKNYHVNVKHMTYPLIVTSKRGAGVFPNYEIVDTKLLPGIDDNEHVFFYLCDWEEINKEPSIRASEAPWDVWSCGVCPNEISPFNATFYDREVAHLYADSLREETLRLDRLTAYRYK